MPFEDLIEVDDTDTRREMIITLGYLNREQLKSFLDWCTNQISHSIVSGSGQRARLEFIQIEGTPSEAYRDILSMITHYGLPIQKILRELERRARKAAQ